MFRAITLFLFDLRTSRSVQRDLRNKTNLIISGSRKIPPNLTAPPLGDSWPPPNLTSSIVTSRRSETIHNGPKRTSPKSRYKYARRSDFYQKSLPIRNYSVVPPLTLQGTRILVREICDPHTNTVTLSHTNRLRKTNQLNCTQSLRCARRHSMASGTSESLVVPGPSSKLYRALAVQGIETNMVANSDSTMVPLKMLPDMSLSWLKSCGALRSTQELPIG